MPSGHSVAVTQTVSYAFPPFPWRGEDMHLSDSDGSSRASEPLLSSIQSSVPQIALTLPGKFFHLSNCDSSEVSGWQESQPGSCILLSYRISPGSDDNSGGTREEENGEWDSESSVPHCQQDTLPVLPISLVLGRGLCRHPLWSVAGLGSNSLSWEVRD